MRLTIVSDRLRATVMHREQLRAEGYRDAQLRAAVRAGEVEVYRRAWFVAPDAPAELREAALRGGRLTCVTFARRRGWWMPEGGDDRIHLHFPPGSTGPRAPWDGIAHWSRPIAPVGRSLMATVEDALAHIAVCQPPAVAHVVWESAARAERLAPEALRAIRWPSRAARGLAAEVNGLAGSGVEVLVWRPLRRLRGQGRQQVYLPGEHADALVGAWLVIQIDGWAHHSTSAQRSKDIAHDAELRLRGYTVLRFSYAQVVHDALAVERTVQRALAAGLHTRPSR